MPPIRMRLKIVPPVPDFPEHRVLSWNADLQKRITDLHEGCVRHGIAECHTPLEVDGPETGRRVREGLLVVTRQGDFRITVPGWGATHPLSVTHFRDRAKADTRDLVVHQGEGDFLNSAPSILINSPGTWEDTLENGDLEEPSWRAVCG